MYSYIYIYICVYACMYMCIYVYIYIYLLRDLLCRARQQKTAGMKINRLIEGFLSAPPVRVNNHILPRRPLVFMHQARAGLGLSSKMPRGVAHYPTVREYRPIESIIFGLYCLYSLFWDVLSLFWAFWSSRESCPC